MVRIIDADALKMNFPHDEDWDYPVNTNQYVSELIDEAPTVDAIPIQYILTTIREWNRDGYAESAEALEILVMNWDKENTEWAERKSE